MGSFNLNDYDTVDSRIAQFWASHPEGAIRTDLVHDDGERVVVRADVYRDKDHARPCAVGYAEERRGQGNVNKTSHLENCETSAIGRALANLGYQTKKRQSQEEMKKVERYKEHPPFNLSEYVASLAFSEADFNTVKTMFSDPDARKELFREAWDNNVETSREFFDFVDRKPQANGLPPGGVLR